MFGSFFRSLPLLPSLLMSAGKLLIVRETKDLIYYFFFASFCLLLKPENVEESSIEVVDFIRICHTATKSIFVNSMQSVNGIRVSS